MIIATIGHQDYELANMADAEALLNIMSRALPVSSQYIAKAGGRFWTEDTGDRYLRVEIVSSTRISEEQLAALNAEPLR